MEMGHADTCFNLVFLSLNAFIEDGAKDCRNSKNNNNESLHNSAFQKK